VFRTFFLAAGALSLLALGSTPLSAQPAPTPDDLALHPGDTITWTPVTPHKVRFGGVAGTVTLTPFSDVQKVLKDITPSLTADSQGIATTPAGGVKVTATVQLDASVPNGSEFFFTCGVPQHSAGMVTVPFKVTPRTGQPVRNVQIVTPDDGSRKWILKTDHGDTLLGGH
jgi:hypothetical protein